MKMYIFKKNGTKEILNTTKILNRILWAKYKKEPELHIEENYLYNKVINALGQNIKSKDLDILIAETAASMSIKHPDYNIFAGYIMISNLHKNTPHSFSECIHVLYENGTINNDLYTLVQENKKEIDSWIINDYDYDFDYFAFKTLEKAYLLKIFDTDSINHKNKTFKIVERPQYMFLRVALAIHGTNLIEAYNTYKLMGQKFFIHASPTLFNAGTKKQQMSSCFLLHMNHDSVEGIYKSLTDCAIISKYSGGIGLSIHNIRSRGAFVGNSSNSNGLTGMLRVFNSSSCYIDQGSGKRKGNIAVYLEPWHADICEFLDLKKNTGLEEERARDLFYALWVPDLFMKRVLNNEPWSLMCPQTVKNLHHLYGKDFEEKYIQYEIEGKINSTIPARFLWQKIIVSQIETGTPYILFKDHINLKSNQKNLGTITSSNLCAEIVQYTSPEETAVCNLASINLTKMVSINDDDESFFDFETLTTVTQQVTKNLNKIIDINFYPVKEAETSNMRHRPIGIGVQGLADVFAKLQIAYDSEYAKQLNSDIFETIYYSALTTSCELSKQHGPYSTFHNSPSSQGILQFDLWNEPQDSIVKTNYTKPFYDWDECKKNIQKYGLRNSLTTAAMPTASTAQILGNNESFEPFTSNLYTRRVFSGEFIMNNKYLVKELEKINLWNEETRQNIMKNNGSIQTIEYIPDWIKEIYKTVWEIKVVDLIDMSASRGRFIDQSQSFNIFVDNPSVNKISSLLMYGWKKGLKTGMYYLRIKSAANPIQFTVDSPNGSAIVNNEIERCKPECIVCES